MLTSFKVDRLFGVRCHSSGIVQSRKQGAARHFPSGTELRAGVLNRHPVFV